MQSLHVSYLRRHGVVVKVLNPNQDPLGNLEDMRILMKLRLKFDLVGIEF